VRDALKELSKINIAVVGISPDQPETQKKFDDKHNLGFSLLSDPDHKIAEAYGVWGEKKMYGKTFMGIIRSSFLIDEKGKILNAWYKISPKNTVQELMKVLD
jgi:peroxiredoxin Q/BCP